MPIFPTRRVVFQEEVKLIGHTLHKDCGNTSSYGNNAVQDAIFFSQTYLHAFLRGFRRIKTIIGRVKSILAPQLMFSSHFFFAGRVLVNLVSSVSESSSA